MLAATLWWAPAVAQPAAHAAPAAGPNVIIILTDDQGYGDFACHGNPLLKTPQLDKLHAESIRLTDFHVAPMCSPTRGELMTGLDALRSGACSVTAGRSHFRRGLPTLADIFAAGGYRTALFGKWHLGDSYPDLPQYHGFQESVYLPGYGVTSISEPWHNDLFDGRYYHNGVLRQYPGYCTDVWFQLGIDWMKERQASRQPFFLYLPLNAAHTPTWVAAKYRAPYEGKVKDAGFFGMLANVDENMGKLDAFLHSSGLYENTIVIYLTDNGGTSGVATFNAGMRGHKTTVYEGGHRAACFFRWPGGRLGSPRDIDSLTQVQDLLPTLIDLCGLERPKHATLDGASLARLLRGETTSLPDRMLVVQYGQAPKKWDAAVLWDKWRLVGENELYDLAADPGQAKNIAAEHPDILKKMRAHYESWWTSVLPAIDDINPVSIGADEQNPVRITANDWANVYCDNISHILAGRKVNGAWHLLVERDGVYQFSLRRWPKEAHAPIAAGVPAFKTAEGGFPAGKALPIVKARLKIGDVDQSLPVGPRDEQITFTVPLKKGAKPELQTWFYDDQGAELCGAYYVDVLRNEIVSRAVTRSRR